MGKGGPLETMGQFSMSQPWTTTIEDSLQRWANDARGRSRDHEITARRLRLMHNILAPLLFTLSIATLGGSPPEIGRSSGREQCPTIDLTTFLVCSIGQVLLYTLDLSGKRERHLRFAARYADMCSDIVDVLSKPERCRPLAEVFHAKMKTMHLSLHRNSPGLLHINSGLGTQRLMVDCVEDIVDATARR